MTDDFKSECEKSKQLLLKKLKEINENEVLGDSDLKDLHCIYETLLHIESLEDKQH